MSELKVYKMVDEYYCDDSFCVVPSDVYLKSEADEVIAKLNRQVEFLQTTHSSCNNCNKCADGMGRVFDKSLDELKREKDLKIKELEKRTKYTLKNLRVAFADAMRQVWSKEVELCYHENVSSYQAHTLELFWEKVKDTLKRKNLK